MSVDFYSTIEKDIQDEAGDSTKYTNLANIAPTDKARRILLDIAEEERGHKKFLEEILADKPANTTTEEGIK